MFIYHHGGRKGLTQLKNPAAKEITQKNLHKLERKQSP